MPLSHSKRPPPLLAIIGDSCSWRSTPGDLEYLCFFFPEPAVIGSGGSPSVEGIDRDSVCLAGFTFPPSMVPSLVAANWLSLVLSLFGGVLGIPVHVEVDQSVWGGCCRHHVDWQMVSPLKVGVTIQDHDDNVVRMPAAASGHHTWNHGEV